MDRVTAAGVLLTKVAERRATLLGLNPQMGHAVAVIQHEPEHQMTTTDELERAIARIQVQRKKLDNPDDGDDRSELHPATNQACLYGHAT